MAEPIWGDGMSGRKDCIKLNSAALMGWRVLRGDSMMVKDGTLLDAIAEALAERR